MLGLPALERLFRQLLLSELSMYKKDGCTHIGLENKMEYRLGFLYHYKSCFTHCTKYMLVQMSLLPILDYVDVICYMASKTLLMKLDVLYHSATSFVTGDNSPFTIDLYNLIN